MRNLIGFSVDKTGALHSAFKGAEAFYSICSDAFTMEVGACKIQYYSKVSQPKESILRADYIKSITKGTSNGIKVDEISMHFIEYDIESKTLNSDFTKESLDEIRKLSGSTDVMMQANLLGVPVAAYLKENKPYCYDVVKNMGNSACSIAMATANFISLGVLDLADAFERCAKQSKTAIDLWSSMPIEQIIEEYGAKAMPAACRKFMDEGLYNSATYRTLTSCLRVITDKEDGNNAIILTKFLKDGHRLIDKRTYDWERRLEAALKALMQLVEEGYNSVKVLEYSLRQAFYYGEFEFPAHEIVLLRDYANMMEELHIQNYDRFPTNLIRAHNVAVANINMMNASTSQETIDAFKKAVDNYRYLGGTIRGKDKKEWILKVPESPQDLVNEGVALNHCVSSYTTLVCNGAAQILFLRTADDPGTPLYTVDVADDKVIEAKGNANTDVPDEVNEILKAFEKKWKEGKK